MGERKEMKKKFSRRMGREIFLTGMVRKGLSYEKGMRIKIFDLPCMIANYNIYFK